MQERARTWAGAVAPAHVALAALVPAALWLTRGPVRELDVFWHVLVGRDILSRHTVSGVGTGWLGVPVKPWLTSQWLAEVGYAELVDQAGWRALVALRLVVLLLTLTALVATLLPHRRLLLAAPVVVLAGVGVTNLTQDRPQSVSYLFLVLLAFWCGRLLDSGRRPPLVPVALICLFWAQVHGLWILAPAAFLLAAVGLALGGPRRNRTAIQGSLLAALASMTGVVNPQGLGSFTLPLRLDNATSAIAEWQHTTIASVFSVAWAVLLLLTVVAWARAPRAVPAAEVVWVVAWWAFAVLAYRNVVPSLLLIAPVCLTGMERAWGERAARLTKPSGPRETRILLAAVVALLAGGLVIAGVSLPRVDPLAKAPARHIALRLAESPTPVRVFNAYNASGSLAAFGGGKVRLVVDGRADLWGDAYIRRIMDAQSLAPGWQQTFRVSTRTLRC